MIVERATVHDAAEILALQKLAYRDEAEIYNDYSIPPLTQTLEEMEADFDRQLFLKASTAGQIIGSVRAYMEQGTCFVGRLIVHPDYQKNGFGSQIMDRLMAFIEKQAPKKSGAFVGLMIAPGLEPFYRKYGFTCLPNHSPAMAIWRNGH